MRGAVFLGKLHLRWCERCNLPILEEASCPKGHETTPVPLTPPGDIYPAFQGTLSNLRAILDQNYGPNVGARLFPDNKVVVVNDIPSEDKAMEIILDGRVIGRFFYSPAEETWTFKPTLEGARRLSPLSEKKKVLVDEGASRSIIGGSSLLAPGVLHADSSIVRGDEVIVTDEKGEVVAVGSAKMNGRSMVAESHGHAVKIRSSSLPEPARVLPGGQTWKDAVKANQEVLSRREGEALEFIRKHAAANPGRVCVAFSGGKDSLCTLLLVARAIRDFKILFVDTGIEFPETVQYTYRVIRELGLEDRLIVESVGDRFWKSMETFGPPARDARWCCKVCKLGPTTSVIHKFFGGRVLMFVGQRRYESIQRQSRRRVSKNPWVPGQTAASPIQHWTALHVWLYLMSRGVSVNPLYDEGYARIGCFMCPASEMWQFRLLERTHPDLYEKWTNQLDFLIRSRADPSLDVDEFIKKGLWRWRNPPGWVKKRVATYGSFEKIQRPRYSKKRSEDGVTVYSTLNHTPDLKRVENSMRALGQTVGHEGGVSVDAHGIHVYVSSDRRLQVGPTEDESRAVDIHEKAFSCIVKADFCVGCGTCVGVCPTQSIQIRDGKAWIGESCTHCSSCISLCPLLTWALRTTAKPFG